MEYGFENILEKRKKGSLKIYLGYAAGVGKTYAMLQEAHRLKERGFDVVIGYVEPHNRPETTALIEKLEVLPRRKITTGGKEFEELDTKAIITRSPQVVLIDELAHTNLDDTGHEKRYLDVLEVLEHQINVITTLNVQHLESVADRIAAVAKTQVRERIPDYVLRWADQIVNVDVSIDELRERLRSGKIYCSQQAELALLNFFTPQNLSVFREIALKEAAGDQVRKIEEQALLEGKIGQITLENVMVGLYGNSPHADVVIRKGARLANVLSSQLYVVYIQRRNETATRVDAEEQRKLQNSLTMAKTLGAEVITLQGDHIASLFCQFAHEYHIRHAVFEKPLLSPLQQRFWGTVSSQFAYDAVGVDVHLVGTVEG